MRTLRRLTIVGVITFALVSWGSPASAAGGGGTAVLGNGTISPGLTTTPTNQSGSFNGTATGALVSSKPAAFAGSLNCGFTFASIVAETVAHGAGGASGVCSGSSAVDGTPASVVCSLTYARAGAIVVIVSAAGVPGACNFSVGGVGGSTGVLAGSFVFVPTSPPGAPATAYTLAGVAAGAAA